MEKKISNIVSNGLYLLDLSARWLAFSPTVVITSFGPPVEGYISCYLYGCSIDKCEFSNITCNKCPNCLGFYTDFISNYILR